MKSPDLGVLLPLAETSAAWRQGEEVFEGIVSAASVEALADCLEGPVPSATVPPMWWVPAPVSWPPRSSLGVDGHPTEGLGYPPLADRRRLFAGGRLEVYRRVDVGSRIRKVARVLRVAPKQTRSGAMLFVTMGHRYFGARGELIASEEQDIAYRSGSAAPAAPGSQASTASPGAARPSLALRPDGITLFRFSALTGNSHRIHYDREYAEGVERLPGLLVHGPLLALLLLELPRRLAPEWTVRSFEFRVRTPVVSGTEVVAEVAAAQDRCWQLRAGVGGGVAVTGTVRFA